MAEEGTTTNENEATATQVETVETTVETPASTATNTEQAAETTVAEPSEEAIVSYFKSKGREVASVEELFTEKIKEVNPYADVNEELKQILDYNKQTGRSISDYLKLQENIDDRPLLDLALEKAAKEAGGSFSKEDLTSYIEDVVGVDLSGELTASETIKLTKFVKDYRDQLKADQEKYKAPLAKSPEATATQVEMITLDNGQKVEKSVFEAHEKTRQIYLNDIKEAVNSVAASSISIEFDNNGVKEELSYGYDYDANDKQAMLSLSDDLDGTINKLFKTDKGLNYQELLESAWFLDKVNREKWGAAIANKARAAAIEELTKADNNVNFNTNGMPRQAGNPNVKIVPIDQLFKL